MQLFSANAKKFSKSNKDFITFVTDDSLNFLSKFKKDIDFLYLDSLDGQFEGASSHQLEEIKIAKKNLKEMLHPKTFKNCPQKLLIIGPNFFFQYCQLAQNQPKSHFLFHKNVSLDFYIMTLVQSTWGIQLYAVPQQALQTRCGFSYPNASPLICEHWPSTTSPHRRQW